MDLWLSSMIDCIHVYVFSLLWKTAFKQYRQLLDTSQQLGYLSSSLAFFYRILASFSIHRGSFWMLDRFSIAVQSIKVGFCSIAAQQLLDPWSSCMHCFSHVLHLSFILSSIASCFIRFMHLYGFFVPPWSSLYFSGEAFQLLVPFVNHDKNREKLWRKCDFYYYLFLFYFIIFFNFIIFILNSTC